MTYMAGSQWNDLFNVIVVTAGKPGFFTHRTGHFRKYLPDKKILSWHQIEQFRPGRIYARVC